MYMKKLISLIFIICFFATAFIGCNNLKNPPPNHDIWDGSVAESFAGGDGSEKSPYIIEKASQLAFLASEVNLGNDYTGKFFSLISDLDLNNTEWTPIGNGKHPFNGFFDGNGHSIKNLMIANGVQPSATGLFGSCLNSVIENLTIDKSRITIKNTSGGAFVSAGVLAGEIKADTSTEISDITISNAIITCDFASGNIPTNLRIGGITGYMYADFESTCTMSQLQTDVQISIEDRRGGDNYIGGIIGFSMTRNLFNVQACASYLSVEVDTDNCYAQHNYFGAFGVLSAHKVALTDMFSKVAVNKIHDYFHGYSAYTANVISAQTDRGVLENGGFEFKNLFGVVEQTNKLTGEKVTSMQLYEIPPSGIYTETNCQGCEALPKHHGFDETIWNLDDLYNPKLK